MTQPLMPPAWADAILRLSLKRSDRESVSGDLLEEYRAAIVPSRGAVAADAWYVRQVAGFVWRATRRWALIFAAAFLARTAYDWLVPTTDFHARSLATTTIAVAMLASMGFWAAWRSGSLVAGTLLTVVMSQIAAVFSIAGASAMLAIWHDPDTMRAIAGSGGLAEVYVLPWMGIVPAVIVGTAAGVVGSASRKLLR